MSTVCYLGQMSGTSADALELAAIDTSNRCLAHCQHPYSAGLRKTLRTACNDHSTDVDEAEATFTDFLIRASQQFIRHHSLSSALCFSLHGHTLLHDPANGVTKTLLNPKRVAQSCKMRVVANIRQSDVIAGGQGAPLAPLFHQQIFAHRGRNRAVVNLGGIANITILSGNELIAGFDTGPANTLLDYVCRNYFGCPFDDQGARARSATMCGAVLQCLLDDPYFQLPAPKSTGLEYFNWHWATTAAAGKKITGDQWLATLVELTSLTVVAPLGSYHIDELILTGGGVHNLFLIERIAAAARVPVLLCTDFGWQPEWIEAASWAWLGRQRIEGKTISTAKITGATEPILGGEIFTP